MSENTIMKAVYGCSHCGWIAKIAIELLIKVSKQTCSLRITFLIVKYETNQYVLGKVSFILYFGGQDIKDKRSDGFA
jgi:hypothetical protein